MKTTFIIRPLTLISILAFSLTITACGDDSSTSNNNEAAIQQASEELQTGYPKIVHDSYKDSLEYAKKMDAAIDTFIETPTDEHLKAAKEAWLAAREPYLETEVYRFYDGPIDNAETGVEGLLNAWPLDEAYIDSVAGDDSAGIINNPSQTISKEKLVALNEQGGEKNIATGYHAIEFLLWGQDTSETGPGNRPFTDFVEGTDGTLPNANRRKNYLGVVSDLLIDHLQQMVDAWAPEADNYRKSFQTDITAKEAVRRALTGMIVLSGFETGGERLQAALSAGDQEEEHSCFSDNTHRDMIQDVQGVKNVWEGIYEDEDGSLTETAGVQAVIAAENSDLAAQITTQIDESLRLANELPVPFDQAIQADNAEGKAKISDLINSLRSLESLLEEGFRGLDLPVPSTE